MKIRALFLIFALLTVTCFAKEARRLHDVKKLWLMEKSRIAIPDGWVQVNKEKGSSYEKIEFAKKGWKFSLSFTKWRKTQDPQKIAKKEQEKGKKKKGVRVNWRNGCMASLVHKDTGKLYLEKAYSSKGLFVFEASAPRGDAKEFRADLSFMLDSFRAHAEKSYQEAQKRKR